MIESLIKICVEKTREGFKRKIVEKVKQKPKQEFLINFTTGASLFFEIKIEFTKGIIIKIKRLNFAVKRNPIIIEIKLLYLFNFELSNFI